MIADDPASPQLVKYIEFTTLYPIVRNVTAKPVATISATLLLHPNKPAYCFPATKNAIAIINPIINNILFVVFLKAKAISFSFAPQHLLTRGLIPCPNPIQIIL